MIDMASRSEMMAMLGLAGSVWNFSCMFIVLYFDGPEFYICDIYGRLP